MKYSSPNKQLSLDTFKSSLDGLSKANRWVKLGDTLPWEEIENIYNTRLNNTHKGARNKPARVIIGALLIKHKMNLSDVETIEAIRENPYMQYMLGLSEFTDTTVFDPSLFVTIRKRIGMDDFNDMSESLLKLQVKLIQEQKKEEKQKEEDDDPSANMPVSPSTHTGTLKVDATCADAEMRFPTDLDLLHDGVKVVDRVINRICKGSGFKFPQTRLKEIHSKYLNIIKLRNKSKKKINDCKEYLLTMLYRNISTCLGLISSSSTSVFDNLRQRDKNLFTTVLKLYYQQKEMFKCGIHVCSNRIVSVFQPHVRPIVRGKAKSKVEFGAKLGACIVKGYTFIDHHSWDAYNECDDLMIHLRAYKKRFGFLPQKLEGDKIYMNRKNRRILKLLRIEIGGKPLGRPSKEHQTKEYKEQMAKNIGERNEIEATFGTGKRIYRADNIRAKLPDTGASWVCACYFVKNVMKFLKELLRDLILMLHFLLNWGNQSQLLARF